MLSLSDDRFRSGCGLSRLPFVIVQIHQFDTPFSHEGWKAVRDAQKRTTEAVPMCALVRIDDLGCHGMIHPDNKLAVAGRILDAFRTLGL